VTQLGCFFQPCPYHIELCFVPRPALLSQAEFFHLGVTSYDLCDDTPMSSPVLIPGLQPMFVSTTTCAFICGRAVSFLKRCCQLLPLPDPHDACHGLDVF